MPLGLGTPLGCIQLLRLFGVPTLYAFRHVISTQKTATSLPPFRVAFSPIRKPAYRLTRLLASERVDVRHPFIADALVFNLLQ